MLSSWQDFTNIPKELRLFLESRYSLGSLNVLDETSASDQQSTKYLFSLSDGNFVESVILRNNDRITLCISTQSGCPVGCVFCATGKFGFFRDLTSGEIVEQVIHLSRLLSQQDEHITNIVLMGMGEPFLNFEATLDAVKRFNDNSGMNIGARRITISTIGIPDKILRFAQEGLQINLAVSLHAPNDTLRRELVPVAAKIHLSELMQACRQYIKATNRRITFEYVLINGRERSTSTGRGISGSSKWNALPRQLNWVESHHALLRPNTQPSNYECFRAYSAFTQYSHFNPQQPGIGYPGCLRTTCGKNAQIKQDKIA